MVRIHLPPAANRMRTSVFGWASHRSRSEESSPKYLPARFSAAVDRSHCLCCPFGLLYSNARIWCLTHRRCRSGCACRSSASTLRSAVTGSPAEEDGFELSIPLGWNNGSGPLRSTLGASTLPLKELIDFVRAQ